MMVALMAFQAALWTHARTEARAIARDAAVLVARSDVPIPAAVESAKERLLAQQNLTSSEISVVDDGTLVVATVDASAPGMFRFTERKIEVVEAVPKEGFQVP